ncbi:MAG: RNA polymerase sigma-54 factor [Myxococcales bacterium]|nr:RNA polymerase sigma-54 factor [Myxococcales bacterium]
MSDIFLRQELRLQQKLVMTQQLQLAIRLLQMSRLEIDQEIREQLTENPCLEEDLESQHQTAPDQLLQGVEDRKPSLDEIEERQTFSQDQPETPETAQTSPESAAVESTAETPQPDKDANDLNWDRFVEHYESFRDGGHVVRRDADETPSFENFVASPISLHDHLIWQIRMADLDELQVAVATELIGNIDDTGYLRNEVGDDLVEAVAQDLGAPNEYVEEVLGQIQRLDPVGVGARDLRECLLVQAEHYYPEEAQLKRLIDVHLEDLERRRVKQVARALGISTEELGRLVELMGNLEPKPGRGFGGEHNPYIVPDVQVHKIDDEYVVILNDDGMTRLRVSQHYRKGLKGQNENAREFIKKRLGAAVWFIKSIEQRQQTIRKVSESIVQFQREFLEKGSEFLRPLVLRDVATDIGMHESTVSRVTSNKYMHTPQGIFPMKYFFNSRIERAGSGDLASEAVKKKILRFIQEEDGRRPLSDQGISNLLKSSEGIRIARRTVAKYREQMGIGSSSERKKLV